MNRLIEHANVPVKTATRALRTIESITLTAAQQTGKSKPEFGGHGIVEQRIDSAVRIDGKATAQQEPAVLVATPSE